MQGNAVNGSGETFGQAITTKAYDAATGTLYVGLASGGANFALSKVIRPLTQTQPQFITLAPEGPTNNAGIEFLTLTTTQGDTNPAPIFVIESSSPFTQNVVSAAPNSNGTPVTQSSPLNDATGGSQTSGIVGIAANPSFVFAAVGVSGGSFPEVGSGIALIEIEGVLSLEVQDATTGLAGNKAQPFDIAQPEIQIVAPPTSIENAISMFWDAPLQRLYLGLQLTTAGTAGNGAKGVVMDSVNSAILTLSSFLPNAALINGQTNAIVGAIQDVDPLVVDIFKVATMHTSTGASYLIVNGGVVDPTITTSTGNSIYALPLVDVGDPTNPNQGLLANKNIFNATTHRFETPAAVNADLTFNTDAPARVGTGPLPFQDDQRPNDMVVMGDTVYVSRKGALNSANATGVFFSQAIFDQDGAIVRWTPWSKRGFPPTGTAGVSLFAVDPNTGNVWALDDDDELTMHITAWDTGSQSTDLPTQLNTRMTHGCCCALDLDQSTQGFTGTNNTQQRYALFGGANQIIFARISQANSTSPDLTTPETVIADFSVNQNILQLFLPDKGGSIRALEYSRQASGLNNNYFFAGADKGLYVFTDSNGNGFNEQTLSTLNVAPFNTRSWVKEASIPGAIMDIKTSGNKLYVLAFTSTPAQPFNSILYSIPFATTTTAMFAAPIILAQTATNPVFGTTAYFTSIEIISTNNTGTTEQLLLGTNTGLYRSTRVGGVQAATSQTDAAWSQLDPSFYTDIAGMDNAWHAVYPAPTNDVTSRATAWPISLQDQNNLKTFENSDVQQLVATTAGAGPFNFVPTFFNSNEVNNTNFTTLPKIFRFWSDGNRRFFIVNLLQDPISINHLMVLPFNTAASNVPNAGNQILSTSALTTVKTFHWVQAIGQSGIILAGTNSGVIALE